MGHMSKALIGCTVCHLIYLNVFVLVKTSGAETKEAACFWTSEFYWLCNICCNMCVLLRFSVCYVWIAAMYCVWVCVFWKDRSTMMVYESTHRSKLFKFKFLGSSVAGGVCERRCRLQPMVCILMCVFTCIRIHSNSLRLNKVKKN